MDKLTAKMLNPLSLAYMGDSILDTYIRKHIIIKIKGKPNRLHQLSKQYVSAKGQAYALNILLEESFFNEEEFEIIQRGRNAKSHTKAKNTDIQTYRKSSAIEAVIGYLFLTDETERLEVLINRIINITEERVNTDG
ncbi:mini-ribonuclease 3 [Mammaliicoccus stepanovicii]|uniref:Mini-ribonuclease 3 n=2 Tax=Mammaliicoccus stepanovicii TaxID=643214 RepID=A0A240AB44_9STAP|nr:ribonuclease III [Mammaliicoccus stepanovicii]GGI39755.1 mini-ribonuclease 3 [Mammaliicoccus stepanovicii]SNV80138.1 Small protein; cysteinyl-tRNA synthetase like-protein [Mammaliicoccus stepanovicii]